MDAYLNRQFLDPALLGKFPDEMSEMFGAAWPAMAADEVQQLCPPIDFVGINYYLRLFVRDDSSDGPSAGPPRAAIVSPPNCPRTAMGWEIYPQGLAETLEWVQVPLRRFAALCHRKRRGLRRYPATEWQRERSSSV